MLAVFIFIIGSGLQTAAVDYAMLTVARFIVGVSIGMLSMVRARDYELDSKPLLSASF